MTDLLVDTVMKRHRVTLSILFIGIVAGLISYVAIPKESNPDIDWPVAFVQVAMPGISPEDSERLIVRPLEEQMRDLDGLKKLEGVAYEGGGYVLAEFRPDVDIDKAVLDVREKTDLAERFFPADAEEPRIRQFNASEEDILNISIFGPVDERTLLKVAQSLDDRIRTVTGVLEVDIYGEREELLEVVIDPARLETYAITTGELLSAVQNANRMVPAGSVDTGEGQFSVKVPSLFSDAEEVRSLPVRAQGDGVIRLGDLGEVRRTFYDATGYARYNRQPVLSIGVEKRYGSNILEVANAVKAVIEEESAYWPAGVSHVVTWDQSENIAENLENLISSILMAVLLVMVIIFGALNVRSGLFVATAIPTSFLFSFLVLNMLGMTLNIMVLFGLVIAVGLLVDGAIVVVEYADRKRAEGLNAEDAFSAAAKRMFWPIASSTGTTIAAFLPFLFWNSGVGKFMSYLPITLIVVLTCALVVALLFLPVIGAKFSPKAISREEARQSLAAEADVDPDALTGFLGRYVRFVKATIRRPALTFTAAAAAAVAIAIAFGNFNQGTEFFVKEDPSELRVVVGANAANMSWPEKRELVLAVEERLIGIEGVKGVRTRVRDADGDEGRDTIGRIDLEFPDWDERTVDVATIRDEIKRRLEGLNGVRASITEPQNGPGEGVDIAMEIRARTPAAGDAAADRIMSHLRGLDGIDSASDTRSQGGIEWRLELDRELAGRFGADVNTLGAAVQMVTNGVLVARYRPDDSVEEIDIRARFPDDDRGLAALDRARVTTNQGAVPISNFITRVAAPKVEEIRRLDGERVIEIRADVDDEVVTSAVTDKLKAWLDDQDFGDAQVTFGGDQREADEAQAFFGVAMIVGLALIAFILLIQFNNFYHVALTLSAIIFSVFGALLGFLVLGRYMSIIMTGTGIVALAGIVVNNNIVFIDAYQRFRERGLDPEMAALRTAAQRVRPVLLTTATTMIGLSPLMFGLSVNFGSGVIADGGPNVGWWEPFATAIIFGLGFSTFITLILTPTLLAAQPRQARFLSRIAALWSRKARERLRRPAPWTQGRGGRGGLRPAE